ncbi:MAG: alkaline phosphatase, partial [Victivallaceae bacterium]|nr:alkaline phosphatase [Victivallaceae bacterium]
MKQVNEKNRYLKKERKIFCPENHLEFLYVKVLKTFSLSFLIFSTAAFSAELPKAALPEIRPVKYVFLMIGDGMGTMQRHCAEAYKKSQADKPENARLVMNRFPVTGFTGTLNVNGKITDSAAAGTALACGVKTRNNFLGIGPLGKLKPVSLAYEAQKHGMKVGIISSVPVDHATPAAFYANVPSRQMYYEIAMSISSSGFDFLGGSGSLAEKR